jgi:hypothetical protein
MENEETIGTTIPELFYWENPFFITYQTEAENGVFGKMLQICPPIDPRIGTPTFSGRETSVIELNNIEKEKMKEFLTKEFHLDIADADCFVMCKKISDCYKKFC